MRHNLHAMQVESGVYIGMLTLRSALVVIFLLPSWIFMKIAV